MNEIDELHYVVFSGFLRAIDTCCKVILGRSDLFRRGRIDYYEAFDGIQMGWDEMR